MTTCELEGEIIEEVYLEGHICADEFVTDSSVLLLFATDSYALYGAEGDILIYG